MDRYDELKYADLKKEASSRGIKATGAGRTKDILIAELRALDRQASVAVPSKPDNRDEESTRPISPRKDASTSPKPSKESTRPASPIRKPSDGVSAPRSPLKSTATSAKLQERLSVLKRLSQPLYNAIDQLSVPQDQLEIIENELSTVTTEQLNTLSLLLGSDVEALWHDESDFQPLYKRVATLIRILASSYVLAAGLLAYNGELILLLEGKEELIALFVRSYRVAKELNDRLRSKGVHKNWISIFQGEERNVPLTGYLLMAFYENNDDLALRYIFTPSVVTTDELKMLLGELAHYPNISQSRLLRLVLARRDKGLLEALVKSVHPIDYLLTDVVDFSTKQDVDENIKLVLQFIEEVTMEDLNNSIEKAKLRGYKNVVSTLTALKTNLEKGE